MDSLHRIMKTCLSTYCAFCLLIVGFVLGLRLDRLERSIMCVSLPCHIKAFLRKIFIAILR